MSQRVAIVGGGMLGMTLALRLAREGRSVTIFERSPSVGGLAAPWEIGGTTWDRHYHVILRSDVHLLALLDELGLTSALRWKSVGSAFFIDGRIHPFSTLADFVAFPAVGPIEKVRLGLGVLKATRERDLEHLDTITAEQWLRKVFGATLYERLWQPLLRAKLGDAYAQASASFIHATIKRLFGARKNSQKREEFGYVEGGYATIVDRLTTRLAEFGVRIETGADVTAIRRSGAGLAIAFNATSEAYDQIVVTVPAPIAARICDALAPSELLRLRSIRYHGIVCASLLLDRPLGNAYITNIADSSIPFTGVIEMTALVDRDKLGGHSLVYLPRYVDARSPFYLMNDASIQESFILGLQRMHRTFDPSHVRALRISRAPYVFALPEVGSAQRVLPMRTSVSGLFLANSSQILSGTLNVNETIGIAMQAADAVAGCPAGREEARYEAVC